MSRIQRASPIRLAIMLVSVTFALTVACTNPGGGWIDEGDDAFARGDFAAAVESYQRAAVEAPDSAEPYYNAGNSLIRRQENEAAAEHLEQALKTAGPDLAADAAFNLGNAYFEAGDFEAAAAAYVDSLRVDPGDPDAKHNLELALRRAVEQQADEEGEEGEEGDQSGGDDAQERQAAEAGDGERADEGGAETQAEAQQQEALTEEQARQLLDAIAQDAETLQQRLQYDGREPARPAQDW